MITQPVLERKPVSLADIRFQITYHNDACVPDESRPDESHIHSCYEFYFNLSGDVSFLVNNHLYAIRSGDVVITRPGDVHFCILNTACVHEHFCLWVSCLEPEGDPVRRFLDGLSRQNHRSFGSRKEQLAELFRQLLRQDTPGLPGTALLLYLLAFLESRGDPLPEVALPSLPPEMQAIINDINERFAEITHVGEILEHSYISKATLSRWFRKYLRLSPKEFLEAKKLSCAKALLSGGAGVTEACMQVGFNDPSHFIAVFKKRFGETPLQYKNRFLQRRQEK